MLKYLLLLLPFYAQAQLVLDETTQTAFEDAVCQCFAEIAAPTEEAILDCFMQNLGMVEAQLAEHIDPESELSEYDQGVRLGEQFFYDLQDDLIQGCDAYYQFFDQLRDSSLTYMQKEHQGDIGVLNLQVETQNDTSAYLERGLHYFFVGDLDKAEQDYTQSLKLEPANLQASFFLAWTLERKGQMDRAIELYQQAFDGSGMQEMAVIIELVKRKAAEQ